MAAAKMKSWFVIKGCRISIIVRDIGPPSFLTAPQHIWMFNLSQHFIEDKMNIIIFFFIVMKIASIIVTMQAGVKSHTSGVAAGR